MHSWIRNIAHCHFKSRTDPIYCEASFTSRTITIKISIKISIKMILVSTPADDIVSLFLSARSSAALKSPAHANRTETMILSSISWKKERKPFWKWFQRRSFSVFMVTAVVWTGLHACIFILHCLSLSHNRQGFTWRKPERCILTHLLHVSDRLFTHLS